MEDKGPRYKSMLLERRIPLNGKKEEFDNLLNLRKQLINDLRRILKRDKSVANELQQRILSLEDEIVMISFEETEHNV